MTDPIADMIIRIQNGYMARKDEMGCHTQKEEAIAHLEARKICGKVVIADEATKVITLSALCCWDPSSHKVKRISKPGLENMRQPQVSHEHWWIWCLIISTSKGVMSDKKHEN